MPAPSNVTLYRYLPATLDRETLQYLLVGRQNLLDTLFKGLGEASRSKTSRFFLLIGLRGAGKSHLMALLYHKTLDDLFGRIIPVMLGEEYSIFRASDFFLRILEEIGVDTADVVALGDDRQIRDVAVDKLKEIASAEGKQIAVFVENVHELFNQMDVREIQALRSIFQQTDIFSVIASASSVFPGISDHDEPFYDFFRIFHLRELDRGEVKELMRRVARVLGDTAFIENFRSYEPTIEALFPLIGGSPRMFILLYEILTREGIDGIDTVFCKMVDEQTPCYQEMFQKLTGQRRLILDTIFSAETPLTPRKIAERSRSDPATVNAQLRRLERDGYVISHPMKRRMSYEARERLFRLWRTMRRPLGRDRVSAFIEFLKNWHSPNELAATLDRIYRESPEVAEGRIREGRLTTIASYAASGRRNEALAAIESVTEPSTDPEQAMQVMHLYMALAGEELLEGNQANGLRLIGIAYAQNPGAGPVKKATVDFLRRLIGEGEAAVIKSAVGEIIRIRGTEFQQFLKPVVDAVEIIETKDTRLYYTRMQSEEREVVAGIVRAITKSEELASRF